MDRLFANGTVNAAQSGKGPALFLFHSLLSDRASFDAIVPKLSQSFRVIVPQLPGFGQSQAVSGGLAGVADRMAEAVKDGAGPRSARDQGFRGEDPEPNNRPQLGRQRNRARHPSWHQVRGDHAQAADQV